MENPKPLANGGLIDYDEWPLIVVSDKSVTDPETVDKIQETFNSMDATDGTYMFIEHDAGSEIVGRLPKESAPKDINELNDRLAKCLEDWKNAGE